MTADMMDRTTSYPDGDRWTAGSRPVAARPPSAGLPGRRERRSGPVGALAAAVYCTISFPLALFFFVSSWVLCSVGLGIAILWFGVPVLVFGLLVARFGAFLQLGLYESMIGRSMNYQGPRQLRPGSGAFARLASVIGDGGCWRALGFWLAKMVLAPVQFGLAVGLYGYGLGAVTYSVWQRWLPAQQASDGSWHRGAQFGTGLFIDSWPEMVVLALVGAVVLSIAPAMIRVVTAIDRGLLTLLVAGRQHR